jgi:integrase/recombinase XerC
MKRADLNMHNMTAVVKGGKGNRDRTIIWKEKDAWNTLMHYLAERDKLLENGFTIPGEEPVFARHDYHAHARKQIEPMGTNSMRVAHKELCKRAVMKYYNPHALRHRVATNLLNETGNMKAIQDFLGHKHFSTTADTYAHLATDKLIEIVRGGE